jgi:hypothetical protein
MGQQIFHCLLILIFHVFIVVNDISGQSNTITKGHNLIDVYYGFPNFYPIIIKQGYNNNFDLTRGLKPVYKVSNFNPIGIKYERLITDNTGVGLNIFYASSSLKWEDATYNYKTTVSRMRIAITYNNHFIESDKWDCYFLAHFGYSIIDYKFEQTSKITSISPIHPKPDVKFQIPIALRVATGARYYFNKQIAINTEIGIGGILLTSGLTLCF